MLELETLLEIFPTPNTSFMSSTTSLFTAVLFTIVVFDVIVVVPVLYTLYPSAFNYFATLFKIVLSPLPFSSSIFIFELSVFAELSTTVFAADEFV